MKIGKLFHRIPGLLVSVNCLGMILIAGVIAFFGFSMLGSYTRHGDSVVVPNVYGKPYKDAIKALEKEGFRVEIADTGYVDSLKADVVLTQSLRPGSTVKPGRIIQLSINSATPLPRILPDLAENSSLREAQEKLRQAGFTLGEVEYVPSVDRDWVLAVKAGGRNVTAGERVPVTTPIVLVVGDGKKADAYNGEDFAQEPEYRYDTIPVSELGSLGEGDVIIGAPEVIVEEEL